jgi:hypothetical protein
MSPSSLHYLINYSVLLWVSLTQHLKLLCCIFSDLICSGNGNTLVKTHELILLHKPLSTLLKLFFVLVGHLGIKQSRLARYTAHQTWTIISYERGDWCYDTGIPGIRWLCASTFPCASATMHFRVKCLFLDHSDLTGTRCLRFLSILV